MPEIHKGQCHCGKVAMEFDSEPGWLGDKKGPIVGYCHCNLCRQISSSSACHLILAQAGAFKITQGEEDLKEYNPTAKTFRKFCASCGTSVCQGPIGKAISFFCSVLCDFIAALMV